jgi:hypothetical protein
MLHATQLVLVQQGTYYGVLTCSCNRINKIRAKCTTDISIKRSFERRDINRKIAPEMEKLYYVTWFSSNSDHYRGQCTLRVYIGLYIQQVWRRKQHPISRKLVIAHLFFKIVSRYFFTFDHIARKYSDILRQKGLPSEGFRGFSQSLQATASIVN